MIADNCSLDKIRIKRINNQNDYQMEKNKNLNYQDIFLKKIL